MSMRSFNYVMAENRMLIQIATHWYRKYNNAVSPKMVLAKAQAVIEIKRELTEKMKLAEHGEAPYEGYEL